VSEQDEQDYLDALIERAVYLAMLNGAVATMASSMHACPEAWDARARFLADMDRLTTAPGATAAEVEQAAAGILALAAEGD
jgi:hypothetical protein